MNYNGKIDLSRQAEIRILTDLEVNEHASLLSSGSTLLYISSTDKNLYIAETGSNGTTGTSRPISNNTNGTSGTNGSSGMSGTSGSSGTSGTSSSSGTSNGTSGTSGVNGETGTSGTSGEVGTSGTSGRDGEVIDPFDITSTGTTEFKVAAEFMNKTIIFHVSGTTEVGGTDDITNYSRINIISLHSEPIEVITSEGTKLKSKNSYKFIEPFGEAHLIKLDTAVWGLYGDLSDGTPKI